MLMLLKFPKFHLREKCHKRFHYLSMFCLMKFRERVTYSLLILTKNCWRFKKTIQKLNDSYHRYYYLTKSRGTLHFIDTTITMSSTSKGSKTFFVGWLKDAVDCLLVKEWVASTLEVRFTKFCFRRSGVKKWIKVRCEWKYV